jgi:hypothetical protein
MDAMGCAMICDTIDVLGQVSTKRYLCPTRDGRSLTREFSLKNSAAVKYVVALNSELDPFVA